MAVIRTAAGIVWRPGRRGIEVLLRRRTQGGWGLPRGEAAPAEAWHAAAVRGVFEETRCDARIVSFVGAWAAQEPRGLEIAFCWSMELVREGWISHTAWVRPGEALEELDFLPERRLLARAWARRSLERLGDVTPGGSEGLEEARRVVTSALLSM